MSEIKKYLHDELSKVKFSTIEKEYIRENNFYANLGLEIINLRKKKKISQAELCESIHMQQSMMSKIENGLATPNLDTLLRIAEGLNVNMEIIFKEKI